MGHASSRRPARVLYCIDILQTGGAYTELVHLARRLDRDRFLPVGCCVIAATTDRPEAEAELGMPVFNFGKRGAADKYLRVPFEFRRLTRRLTADIVNGILFKANLLASFAGRACPGVAVVRKQEGPYDRDATLSSWDMLCHRASLRLADRIIVNARATYRENVERYGVPAGKVRVVLNGVDTAALRPAGRQARERLGIPPGRKVAVTVARLVPQKGVSFLLRALARIEARERPLALIVGEGELRASLAALASGLGLAADVRFLGTRRDVADVVRAADVFVMPSLFEGMPNAVMEAMALGVPVVATGVDGTAELVADGRTGRLVPPADADALASAIRSALTEREASSRMADRARKEVLEKYTVERMAGDTQSVYEEALGIARGRIRR